MKIASSTWMIPGNSFREKLHHAAEMGFEGMEVRLLEEAATEENIRELEEAFAETGLLPCSLLVPGDTFRRPLCDRDTLEMKKAHARKALEIAARLQAPTLLAPEYHYQNPLPLFDIKCPDEEEQALLTEFLSFASEYAGKVGAKCLIEPINRYETHFYHTLAEAAAAIEAAGAENVLILADLFHMYFEEKDVASAIARYGSSIGHVQIGDSNRMLPGQGHTDFRPAFRELKRSGYTRGIALECGIEGDPEVELPMCVRRLKAMIEEV